MSSFNQKGFTIAKTKTQIRNFAYILLGIWVILVVYVSLQNFNSRATSIIILIFGTMLFFLYTMAIFSNLSMLFITKSHLTDKGLTKRIHMNLKDIIIDEVRLIDFDRFEHPEMGYGFPFGRMDNVRITWNLNTGHCFKYLITDYKNVIYLSTTKKQHFLISLEQPEEFIAALKAATREFKENS